MRGKEWGAFMSEGNSKEIAREEGDTSNILTFLCILVEILQLVCNTLFPLHTTPNMQIQSRRLRFKISWRSERACAATIRSSKSRFAMDICLVRTNHTEHAQQRSSPYGDDL